MAKRRILHKLKLTEISAVDRPCVEGAMVAILKRQDETPAERRAALLQRADELLKLSKFNPHHDQQGRFASLGGGSTSNQFEVGGGSTANQLAVSDGGTPAVTSEHKDQTLRWMQTSIRVAKIASWALVAPAMIAAFTAAAPVSVPFAIGAALSTLVTRAALTRAAAFIAFDQGLSAIIRHREAELAKAAPQDDPILATLKALQAELQRHKPQRPAGGKLNKTERPMHDTTSKADGTAYEDLIAAEINDSSMARYVAEQRLLQKGIRPNDAATINKSRAAVAGFEHRVTSVMARDGLSRFAALRKARDEFPAEFHAYQEA